MWSGRWWLLILVAAGLAAVASLRADAANSTGPKGTTIDVTVKIDLIGDDALKAKIERAVRDYWNTDLNHDGELFRFCGKPVKFAAKVLIIPPGGKRRPDAHLVNQHTIPWGTYAVSNVETSEEIASYDPTAENATGYWSNNASDEDVAHEIGHLLGLPDEYTYVDKNDNRRRDADEPSTPKPEYADDGSLMAEQGGHTLQRHIDEIMDKHKVPDAVYPCTWTGTYDYKIDQHILSNGGIQQWYGSFKIFLKEDKSGFHGTIEGELVEDLNLPHCHARTTLFGLKADLGGERRRPTALRPTRSDPLVASLELKPLKESWIGPQFPACANVGRMKDPHVFGILLPLQHLERREEDVYKYEKTETLSRPGAPTTITKKVVVRPKR